MDFERSIANENCICGPFKYSGYRTHSYTLVLRYLSTHGTEYTPTPSTPIFKYPGYRTHSYTPILRQWSTQGTEHTPTPQYSDTEVLRVPNTLLHPSSRPRPSHTCRTGTSQKGHANEHSPGCQKQSIKLLQAPCLSQRCLIIIMMTMIMMMITKNSRVDGPSFSD